MTFQGFVFSEETSDLSATEYVRACKQLETIENLIGDRDAAIGADPASAAVLTPDEGWHPDSQPSFELDGAAHNAQTSYRLLASQDRDIIRKMRLYEQAFTGYQLATLEFASNRPWVSAKLPNDLDAFLRLCAGPPDEWAFHYAALAGALLEGLRAAPPRKFGELGWLMDGTIVNYDTYSYLERLCLMHENGILQHLRELIDAGRQPQILEIGGGYGGLAYFLMQYFDSRLRYAIVDIPESLAFSSIYCSTLFPQLENQTIERLNAFTLPDGPGFTYIPNTVYRSLETHARDIDLVINTLSLSEMSDAQIEDYCQSVKRFLGRSGLFFEQNHQTNHEGPGGIPIRYFKSLRRCASQLLPPDYVSRRGVANIWVNSDYAG